LRSALFSLVLFSFCANATKQEDLKALRDRIEQLNQQLQEKEESRKEVRDALRASERAISEANRSLAALETERRALRAQAARIAERRRVLESSLAERQAAIERMLVARYAAGSIDTVRVALSGEDPATLARTLHYAGYVSRAAASMLAAYRAGIAESERLAREADERRSRLRSVEQSSRAGREKIIAERREKMRVFEGIAGDIRSSRREIRVLRADESRLGRLVEQIGRVLAQQGATSYGRVERIPESGGKRRLFSALRGKLRLPVLGELTGRFGAPRGAAGTEAKGVFIRAPEGQPVRAIAGGQVVYADWMRGFGNLLIVDHGETYLSIYANNESLLKQIGDGVSPGETIATTGASGGNEETGLYFELRHLGKAFDPLRWVKLR
jgi:septal ring factor EnvC (AmiA/AmiB activator)